MEILYIYLIISGLILLSTALMTIHGDVPDEIDNFYDWVFYGLLWIVIAIKYLIKFIIKIIKL